LVAGNSNTVRYHLDRLSYDEASRLAKRVRRGRPVETVLVDLRRAEHATTAALAKLVVLRCKLRRAGGDLRLTGLHGRARDLYEVNRMTGLLPCEP